MHTIYLYNSLVVFYILWYTVNAECSTGCVSCTDSTCVQCKSQNFLLGGSCHHCPDKCNSCDDYDHCTACKSHKWGFRCEQNCSTNCLNQGCQDDTGYCYQCKSGLYGLQCQRDCTLCENALCDARDCTYGCKSGYYSYNDGSETFCQSCREDCKSCKDSYICDVCNDGFYSYKNLYEGRLYVMCILCPDGKQFCSNICAIQDCNKCQVLTNKTICVECKEGFMFNGDICVERKQNECSHGCSTNCDDHGICLGSCNVGWTGEHCSAPCASQCLTCTRNHSNVCEQCKENYYTTSCNIKCPERCNKVTSKQTCNIDDGYCLNDCDQAYWGPFCNESCPNGCVDGGTSIICERRNGSCTLKCKDGYTGPKCDTFVSTIPIVKSEGIQSTSDDQNSTTEKVDNGKSDAVKKDDDTNTTIIGVSAGGGVLALILIVVLISCFVKRRQKSESNPRESNAGINDVEMSGSALDIEEKDNIYAKPVKPTRKNREKESQQEYIYAQPNKQKKVKKPSKKEIGEPLNLYDNIAVDLEDEDETSEETNADILQLETLDEGTISFIETEVKSPTTDTYYNTASLIRSRIQVTNLLEYVKAKTDYEHEFEKLPKGLTRTCSEALKPINISKNRFNGIYAYDATRVVLKSKNYINANYIDGHVKSQEYIASLGPTNGAMNKFESFWEMIWQERTEKIVMLTHLEESGKMKCEQYWPNQGENKTYSYYSVSCTAEKEFSEFVVREFTICRESNTRSVTQYHYTAWPDKTVPDTVASLVEFRDKVQQTQTTNDGPMLVHCSAGIGRTGTYIALDILIKEGREEGSVDIFGRVAALRGQRAHMVQNLEQYTFLHYCVMYALTCDPQPLSKSAIEQVKTLDNISAQYQTLMEIQITPRTDRKSVEVNQKRKENRKGADIPGDDYRVRLSYTKHDYINAIYLNGYLNANKFIIAQTPLPNTVEDFVSMLYQEECACIVCLDEEHINDKTVGQYLPPANKVSRFGQYQVACRSSNSTEDFVTRELNISRIGSSTSQEISVLHYQFRGWGCSEKVPKSAKSFLNLALDMEKSRKNRGSQKPTVVHCLTGADRSGLFCGVSILLEKFSVEKELSVLNTVCQVRCRRRSAFQDLVHLRFCYACVKEMTKMPVSSDYYNIIKI